MILAGTAYVENGEQVIEWKSESLTLAFESYVACELTGLSTMSSERLEFLSPKLRGMERGVLSATPDLKASSEASVMRQ